MPSAIFPLRWLAALLGILISAGAIFAWVQLNPKNTPGGPDKGLFVPGGAITFSLEQDGSFDINTGDDLLAILCSFDRITQIPTPPWLPYRKEQPSTIQAPWMPSRESIQRMWHQSNLFLRFGP